MEKANNKVLITLGDWSGDGHGKSDKIEVYVSCSAKEMQDAYKASCKLTGVSFNHNDDFTGIKRRDSEKYQVCTGYEQNFISDEIRKIFTELNCPWDDIAIEGWDDEVSPNGYLYTDSFVNLLMWFIGLSLESFEWRLLTKEERTPVFNGWWDNNLNVQLGYGLY